MYGTDKNAGVIPKEIADKLREKQYNNFDEFRNDFWKAVAETDYANEFLINGDPKNYYRMKNGGAPLVVSNQAIMVALHISFIILFQLIKVEVFIL